MKKLLVLLLSMTAGVALADDPRIESTSLTVIDRLETIELINVTEERAPAENVEPLDAELEAILDEIEAIEAEEPK